MKNLPFLEAFFIRDWSALDKPISPESVFVQNRDHSVLEMPVVVKINVPVHGCSIALPDGSVLPAVKKLNEKCA